ncbi:MAG: lvrE [Legionella sp.]|uniref:lvrE n=1 Tax=Legionella sp. TaxID=459 RepID=UPI0039E45E76
MKFVYKPILLVAASLIGTNSFAQPTSKEYVDMQIREVVRSVQEQLNQQRANMDVRLKEVSQSVQVQIHQMQHQVGESYQGGIIFWMDESKQHGLIVAKIDASPESLQWNNGDSGYKVTNARANGLFAGFSNTHLIISEQTIDDQEGQFAALVAQNFSIQEDGKTPCNQAKPCYGSWYLPSVYELVLLNKALTPLGLGNFRHGIYWSSSESDTTQAWLFDFNTGVSQVDDKSTNALIRAIHAF